MTDDASPTTSAEPDEAALPVVASAPPTEPAVEPVPPAPASATPYRTLPEAAALAPFAVPRRASMFGGVVFVFGVLLWAFLVMGELTTSYGPGRRGMLVGEALAVVFVLVTSAAAWNAAMRRSLEAKPASSATAAYVRGAFLAVLAFALWLLVLSCAASLGKSASKNMDGPITSLLLIMSVAAALGGRRLAGLRSLASTTRQRLIVRLLWFAAGLLTFVACVEVLGS